MAQQRKMDRFASAGGQGRLLVRAPSSGNRAFDDYRSETLRRLEDEQREFHDFLDRLRMAKDKSEFDQFMAERRNRPNPEARRRRTDSEFAAAVEPPAVSARQAAFALCGERLRAVSARSTAELRASR